MKQQGLPAKVKVKVIESKSGKYIAELPDYDIHTEADSRGGLDFMINDLIYAYFDVPRKFWGKIWYRPVVSKPKEIDLKKLFQYQKYISSNSVHLIK